MNHAHKDKSSDVWRAPRADIDTILYRLTNCKWSM